MDVMKNPSGTIVKTRTRGNSGVMGAYLVLLLGSGLPCEVTAFVRRRFGSPDR